MAILAHDREDKLIIIDWREVEADIVALEKLERVELRSDREAGAQPIQIVPYDRYLEIGPVLHS